MAIMAENLCHNYFVSTYRVRGGFKIIMAWVSAIIIMLVHIEIYIYTRYYGRKRGGIHPGPRLSVCLGFLP